MHTYNDIQFLLTKFIESFLLIDEDDDAEGDSNSTDSGTPPEYSWMDGLIAIDQPKAKDNVGHNNNSNPDSDHNSDHNGCGNNNNHCHNDNDSHNDNSDHDGNDNGDNSEDNEGQPQPAQCGCNGTSI